MYDSEIVTCDPYLGQIALSADADFVVIASDGIWDFLSFKEVAEIVGALTGSSQVRLVFVVSLRFVLTTTQVKAAELLVDEALKRGSMDNCTAVVVFLSSGRPTSTSLSRTSERDK
jgi:serine/threonine protein phosphatase PrpC